MGRHHSMVAAASSSSSTTATTTTTTTTTTNPTAFFPTLPRRPSLIVEPATPMCHPPCLPRLQSTRIQLQRQRIRDQHASIVVSQRLPGLKTSAAFFASLRTNLQLNASPPLSPLPTPTFAPALFPTPSPLAGIIDDSVQSAQDYISIPLKESRPTTTTSFNSPVFDNSDPLIGLPELKSYITTNPTERYAAARLIFDGALHMRRTADKAFLLHPITLISTLIFLSLQTHFLQTLHLDTPTKVTISLISLLGLLTLSRQATRACLHNARRLKPIDWLDSSADDVLITRFGNETIATLAIAWVPAYPPSPSSSSGHHRRRSGIKGEICAWTVGTKFRGKGVGTALLDEAVRLARRKGAGDLDFAVDHAFSTRALPRVFNRKLDQRETRARAALAAALDANAPLKSRRRRGGSG